MVVKLAVKEITETISVIQSRHSSADVQSGSVFLEEIRSMKTLVAELQQDIAKLQKSIPVTKGTFITLHYITLPYNTLHHITLHCITLHYITLHYITLHYITLHYITLHYVTLHYIT